MTEIRDFFRGELSGCYTIEKDPYNKGCKKKYFSSKELCFPKAKDCENLHEQYHRVCDEVWNEKCDVNKNANKNLDTLRKSRKCSQLRVHFQENCVEKECRDLGHEGAFVKMNKLERKCKGILKERRYKK